jgi:predicted RND superfamily exporter protein
VSDNVFQYFAAEHEFRRDTQLVEDHLSGANELLISVDTQASAGLFDAGVVLAVRDLSDWLIAQPEVRNVVAISDSALLRDAIHNDRLQERLDFLQRNLQERRVVSNPATGLRITADNSATAVSAWLRPLDSAQMIQFNERLLSWSAQHLPELKVTSAGPGLMFAVLGEANIRGMLTALLAALLIAALVLGIALRSLRIALIALACNLLPVLLVFSIWALFNGRISMGAAVVMGMILGIVIDDTIYLLLNHWRLRRSGITQAITGALQQVGPAVIITTIALMAGLGLGMLSQFDPIWSMSVLSTAIIGTALLIDLLLLPALLPREPVPPAAGTIAHA